jgi:hypothetical protein
MVISSLLGVAKSRNPGAIECLLVLIVESVLDIIDVIIHTEACTFSHLQECNILFIQLRDEMYQKAIRVFIFHIIMRVVESQLDSYLLGSKDFDQYVQYFEREIASFLNGSSILVCPLVCSISQERVE